MEAYREAVAAAEAERDRRVLWNIPGWRGEFKDPKSVKGAKWEPKSRRYDTAIKDGQNTIALRSYSDAEKEVALRHYWAVQNANPTSITNQRKRKAERKAANADKRAKDLEKNGDNLGLERELLTNTKDAVTGGVLSFIVLMLQTKADALFRTSDMPKDKYKREQHKTCRNLQVVNYGYHRYQFCDVTGYDGCLVVFECKEDGAIFGAYGDDIDEAYKTYTTNDLIISINKETNKPVESRPWLHYFGKGEEAHIKLKQRLVDECGKDKLPLCSIAEANSELGKKNATEEAGIQHWIRDAFGGIVPDDDPRWLELKQEWQDKKHIYMLTEKNGDVVAYPEHVQQGKTDLFVFRKILDYKNPEEWQCKSARPKNGHGGLEVNMTTASGTIDGKRQRSNTYKAGDNDFYVVTRVSENRFHYWEFTDAEMVEHGYIGEGATDSFYVYTKDAPCAHSGKHAWTVRNYRPHDVAPK